MNSGNMILKTTRSSLLTLIAVMFGTVTLMAQSNNVGIGTAAPHPAAMLEVDAPGSPKKGVLIPTVNTIQLNQLESQYNDELPNGLLVYEEDDGNFWYYQYDQNWNPQNPPFGEWVMLQSLSQSQNTNVPTGGIIMWSGTIASIPTGWALCDGSAPSPYNIDLTDKFVVSVSSANENPGTAPVTGFYVDVEAGNTVAPDRRFFKLAYIIKLP